MAVDKKRRLRRRRKNPGKKYFTTETHNSILEWQDASDEEKNKIYEEKIAVAFEQLAENLIRSHNFLSLHDSFEDLKLDCIENLHSVLPKFDRTRKTMAFSFFNQVAKNFLIIRAKKRTKAMDRMVPLDVIDIENYTQVPSPDDQIIELEDRMEIFQSMEHLQEILTEEEEKQVMSSIKDLFDNAHQLGHLNKRAIFLYLRDQTGLSSKKITTTISKLRKTYKELI